jgi:hypothetical protein
MGGVTISYDGKPIPKGWRMWHAKCRPDPGRLFFELRYHHSEVWKFTLDYRPVDGKFPELWMPPFAWKYATEVEAVSDFLSTQKNSPDECMEHLMKMLHVHSANEKPFALAILDYGEKWKNKKKLLFGSAEGAGMHEQQTTADWLIDYWDWSQPLNAKNIDKKLKELLVAGAKQSLIPEHTYEVDAGWPAGYETVLLDFTKKTGKQGNLPVLLELVSACWNDKVGYWQWQLRLEIPTSSPSVVVIGMLQAFSKHATPPALTCTGVAVMEMNTSVISLQFPLLVEGGEATEWECSLTSDMYPQLFPPAGHVKKGGAYWIPNE